jgi:hypothetical protein
MFKGLIYKLHGTDALFITTYIFRISFTVSSALFVALSVHLLMEWYTSLSRSLRDSLYQSLEICRSVSTSNFAGCLWLIVTRFY